MCSKKVSPSLEAEIIIFICGSGLTQGQEPLSSLAIISIQKDLMQDLKRNTNLYDDVLNKFSKKDRRIDLIH